MSHFPTSAGTYQSPTQLRHTIGAIAAVRGLVPFGLGYCRSSTAEPKPRRSLCGVAARGARTFDQKSDGISLTGTLPRSRRRASALIGAARRGLLPNGRPRELRRRAREREDVRRPRRSARRSSFPLTAATLCPSRRRSLGEAHEGVIFTYDTTTSALVLEQRKGGDPKVPRMHAGCASRARASPPVGSHGAARPAAATGDVPRHQDELRARDRGARERRAFG